MTGASAEALYVDTSALGRVLRGEPGAPAVRAHVARAERVVSSRLLALELRRLALRVDLSDDAEALLANVSLVALDEATLALADVIAPATVASLDAIHLATAVRLAADGFVDAVLTFDHLWPGALAHTASARCPRLRDRPITYINDNSSRRDRPHDLDGSATRW